MKTTLLLISIFTIHSNLIFAQISGVFSLRNTGDKSIVCDISIYEKGVYEIEILAELADDTPFGVLISCGNYTLKNGIIDLKDTYNGFKMQFKYQKQYIISTKTFKWFDNKKFMKSNYSPSSKPLFEAFKIAPLNQERLKFNQLHKKYNPLVLGEYCSPEGLSLKILPGNKYRFAYKTIILSEGMWYRKGNELALFDTTLKHLFYNFIGEAGIICRFLPGHIKGDVLILQ